jgi:hypothetical protein
MKMFFPFTTLHPNANAHLRSEILLLPPSLISLPLGVNNLDKSSANFPNQICPESAVFDGVRVTTLDGTKNGMEIAADLSAPVDTEADEVPAVPLPALAPALVALPRQSLAPGGACAQFHNYTPVSPGPSSSVAPSSVARGIKHRLQNKCNRLHQHQFCSSIHVKHQNQFCCQLHQH